jgi:hypothetical protein
MVIVLCDLEENTREEAARQLGVPQGTVASRLARARTMLAKRLSRRGLVLSSGALVATLSESVAAASVPSSVVSRAVHVATLLAAGKATPGVISAKVAALTEGVLKLMYLAKLKVATAFLLTIGLVAAGAGTLCLSYAYATHQSGRQDEGARQRTGSVDRPRRDKVPGDANDAHVILDKAITALGGEARLKKARTIAWKARGKSFQDGNEYPFTNETTVQGLDQLRMEWEDDFNGNRVMGVTVLNGDKGWRKNGDKLTKLDGDRLANQKRNLYILVVPVTLVPLKEKVFQIKPAGEVQVGDQPAVGLNVTGPDGKDFNLFFDKKSRLPVKLEVRMGSPGKEFIQETTFGDHTDFDGIKRATRIERRRDGEKILEQEITEFRVLDKVTPETFAAPQ